MTVHAASLAFVKVGVEVKECGLYDGASDGAFDHWS